MRDFKKRTRRTRSKRGVHAPHHSSPPPPGAAQLSILLSHSAHPTLHTPMTIVLHMRGLAPRVGGAGRPIPSRLPARAPTAGPPRWCVPFWCIAAFPRRKLARPLDHDPGKTAHTVELVRWRGGRIASPLQTACSKRPNRRMRSLTIPTSATSPLFFFIIFFIPDTQHTRPPCYPRPTSRHRRRWRRRRHHRWRQWRRLERWRRWRRLQLFPLVWRQPFFRPLCPVAGLASPRGRRPVLRLQGRPGAGHRSGGGRRRRHGLPARVGPEGAGLCVCDPGCRVHP